MNLPKSAFVQGETVFVLNPYNGHGYMTIMVPVQYGEEGDVMEQAKSIVISFTDSDLQKFSDWIDAHLLAKAVTLKP